MNVAAISSIKNLDRIVLYAVLFLIFVIVLITFGVASMTSALPRLLGGFIIVVAVGGLFTGRMSINNPFFIGALVVGGFLVIFNPAHQFTIAKMLRTLGMHTSEVVPK